MRQPRQDGGNPGHNVRHCRSPVSENEGRLSRNAAVRTHLYLHCAPLVRAARDRGGDARMARLGRDRAHRRTEIRDRPRADHRRDCSPPADPSKPRYPRVGLLARPLDLHCGSTRAGKMAASPGRRTVPAGQRMAVETWRQRTAMPPVGSDAAAAHRWTISRRMFPLPRAGLAAASCDRATRALGAHELTDSCPSKATKETSNV